MIRIKNVPFQVIGVLAPKVSRHRASQDDVIFVPFTTAEREGYSGASFLVLWVLFASTEQSTDLPEAVEHIREILRARHRLQPDQTDDFTIRTQVDIGKVQERYQSNPHGHAVRYCLGLAAGRGIGIMNILLVSGDRADQRRSGFAWRSVRNACIFSPVPH